MIVLINFLIYFLTLTIQFVNLVITAATIVLVQEHQHAQSVISKLLIIELLQFLQVNVIATLDGMMMELIYFVPNVIKPVKHAMVEE